MIFFRFMLVLLIFSPASVIADVLQYRDEAGRTHFVDSREKVPKQFRSQLDAQKALPAISRLKSGREKLYENEHYDNVASGGGGVEIFVTDWCPHCKELEAFLKKEHVGFTRYDIEHNTKGRKIHDELGGGGIPVIRIGKKVIRGFNEDEIRKALHL